MLSLILSTRKWFPNKSSTRVFFSYRWKSYFQSSFPKKKIRHPFSTFRFFAAPTFCRRVTSRDIFYQKLVGSTRMVKRNFPTAYHHRHGYRLVTMVMRSVPYESLWCSDHTELYDRERQRGVWEFAGRFRYLGTTVRNQGYSTKNLRTNYI